MLKKAMVGGAQIALKGASGWAVDDFKHMIAIEITVVVRMSNLIEV